jgi:hypothetical protein
MLLLLGPAGQLQGPRLSKPLWSGPALQVTSLSLGWSAMRQAEGETPGLTSRSETVGMLRHCTWR